MDIVRFRIAVAAAVTALALAIVATPAVANGVKCERTIAKEAAKYRATAAKIIGRCKETVVTKTGGTPGSVCPTTADQAKVDAAFGKLRQKIATACGGGDR